MYCILQSYSCCSWEAPLSWSFVSTRWLSWCFESFSAQTSTGERAVAASFPACVLRINWLICDSFCFHRHFPFHWTALSNNDRFDFLAPFNLTSASLFLFLYVCLSPVTDPLTSVWNKGSAYKWNTASTILWSLLCTTRGRSYET